MESITTKFRPKCDLEQQERRNNIHWWLLFGLVLILAILTRLHKIEEPDHICWDETHFGKMGSWYINRTFFFDVHPPLGKMLIGLSGKLTGYNGTFAFNKPGDKYGDHNYLGMRIFCATLGLLIIPFCYISIWELSHSLSAAFLSATFIIFDVGMLTLSQYILLDPILLFFIAGAFMGSVKFRNCESQEFKFQWWFWLIWTGVFLACAISVKFVGLFIILLVGLRTVKELWDILGDLNHGISYFIKHLLARVACLICLPIVLYMTFFYIHLAVLSKSGNGDGFFSSAFQSQLEGNSLYNASMPEFLAYGAEITLKNHRTGGGYLHSHWHLYPEGVGAKQQQVTAYTHKDENNRWIVKRYDKDIDLNDTEPELVRNGDLIRLQHVITGRNLHSHKEMAPITKRHFQVTCYGEDGKGDANDVWQLQMLNVDESNKVPVQTVVTRFRLVHFLSKCALHSHSKQLPKWGYEQMEVTCNPNLLDKHTIWNVEDNQHSKLPNVSFHIFAPSFLQKFVEAHLVMFQGNAGLKPKEGEVTSRPWQWPINYKGQFFSGSQYRVYLLGNPIIWWANIVFLLLYVLIQVALFIHRQRNRETSFEEQDQNDYLTNTTVWLSIGWALHYIPFFAMGRILYFHHYFPALIFSSSLTAVVVDYVLHKTCQLLPENLRSTFFHTFYGSLIGIVIYSFYLFSPLSYGFIGSEIINESVISMNAALNQTQGPMSSLKWLESWEF